MEALTYRLRGHYVGDPEATYRMREEVEAWREKDPLLRARGTLLQNGSAAAGLDALDQAIKEKLAALEAWALEQPFPTLEQSVDHVTIPLTMQGGCTCL